MARKQRKVYVWHGLSSVKDFLGNIRYGSAMICAFCFGWARVEDRPLVVCFPNLFRYCSKSEGDGRRGLEAGCRLKVQVLWGLVCRRHLAEQEAMHIQAMVRLIINSVCMPVEGTDRRLWTGRSDCYVTVDSFLFNYWWWRGGAPPTPTSHVMEDFELQE